MSTTPLSPPDPSTLEEMRQQYLRRTFIGKALLVTQFVALQVALFGGVLGGLYFQLSPLEMSVLGVGLIALPGLGLLATVWVFQRSTQSVITAARTVMEVEKHPGFPLIVLLLFVGLPLGAAGHVVMGGGGNWHIAPLFVWMGLIHPFIRRWWNPGLQLWAAVVTSLWLFVGAILSVALVQYMGDINALNVSVVWLFCAPQGLPIFLLRGPLSRLAVREEPLGTLARPLAAFLPMTQQAAIKHLMGRDEEAILQLKHILARPINGISGFESLLLLAELLVDREDPRGMKLYTAAAHLYPANPIPFLGLARAHETSDPSLAIAYLDFAEENSTRSITGNISEEIQTLRKRLSEVEVTPRPES